MSALARDKFLSVLRILISGASGLIGAAVVQALESKGHEVTRLVRLPTHEAHEIQWNPMLPVRPEMVSGFDTMIHLSGESIAGRWSPEKKRRIRESRIESTRNLVTALIKADKPPHTFICASAVGYYGNRGDEILTEESPSGEGFLPEVCREWEAATKPAASAGIRTLNLRFGIVLSRDGGALKQMLTPYRIGLGGRIGSGRQWWSWIHIDDAVSAVMQMLQEGAGVERTRPPFQTITGPVNLVAPNPATSAEFARTLAHVLKRPAKFPIPAFALKLALGEFAEAGVLASARVLPKKLIGSGFEFRYAELGPALIHILSSHR